MCILKRSKSNLQVNALATTYPCGVPSLVVGSLTGEFASLLSRELNLTRAKELLELGRDRQDCKDTAWLALELRVAPSLGNFQQEHGAGGVTQTELAC